MIAASQDLNYLASTIGNFFMTMIFNLARGLDIYCGCFSTSMEGTNNAPMAWYVIRDGLFLLPAFYLLYRTFRGKRRAVS